MSTPYEDIYAKIQDDVHRLDLGPVSAGGTGEIDRRIQRALLKYHRKDNWKRDLIEQEYVFALEQTAVPTTIVVGADSLFMTQFGQVAQGVFIQQINLDYLTRYRQTAYIRKWQTVTRYGTSITDPATGQQGTLANGDFTERSPDRMFDGYGYDINDVMYLSGNNINLRSSTPMSKAYIGYFSDPVITPVTDIASWIALGYQELLAAEVAAMIFKRSGKDEEAKAQAGVLAVEIGLLESANVRLALA